MHEIIIRQIAFGADGGPANLANGIELPIDNETLDKTMMCMKVKYPYIAHSYSFRLDGLNGQITGPQPLDKLNSLATLLNGMYEGCSNLNFAADISQNLRCYDFAPTAEAWAENHLLRQGVEPTLTGCFDLKTLGNTLAADNGVVITETGVISRNGHEFIYDYYQPQESHTQENHTQEKEIRLFCPLEVTTDPDSTLGEEYGEIVSEFENATIPNSVAADYKDEILAALEKELHPEERERGLAKYLDDNLAAKVSYIWPSVEVWNDKLYGVIDIRW